MPSLANSRHERFAQELASGKSASEAYKAAGYKPNRGNAATLKQDQSISNRIAEILAERQEVHAEATERAIERVSLTKEWVIGRLIENAERAMQAEAVMKDGKETGEYKYEGTVANRALELLGRELGMFIERKEIGAPGDFDRLSDKELVDELMREAKELGVAVPATAH